MYGRLVNVPRLLASDRQDVVRHPVLEAAAHALGTRYQCTFDCLHMALYRSGNDSIAMHQDKVKDPNASLVAILSLGQPRRFIVRPVIRNRTTARKRYRFALGWGDLLLMGGSCQRDWEHGIPKVSHASPRMSIMFRQTGSKAMRYAS